MSDSENVPASINIQTNEDLPEHDVALVVFTRVRAIDLRDAGHIAARAVGQALGEPQRAVDGWRIELTFEDLRPKSGGFQVPVEVTDVLELGMACGDRYLHVVPTSKAYSRNLLDLSSDGDKENLHDS